MEVTVNDNQQMSQVKKICIKDKHSSWAYSKVSDLSSQTWYTPLVEVNQAALDWSFRKMVGSWVSKPVNIVLIDPLSEWKVILFQSA